ncbi:MAG TPA: hypothetical protein PLO93_02720 [Candidatus Omnitrophota bacterium]|nr:hypothetical protein [Candidatus Omnitrophota bacterium]HQL41187.1 hypothetical protein [Candidatus Omnitrophota bacterium]
MNLKKFSVLCLTVTIFSLIYIQMQVMIYDLAYQAKQREDQALKLSDNNTHATVNIARLKSAQNLGAHFFDKNVDVDFASRGNIIDVQATPAELVKADRAVSPTIVKRASSLLDKVFGFRSIAEARPIR